MTGFATRAINYEALADAYRKALVDVLRGHSAGEDYLELWVPDEDPVKSILNMIEAAQLAGRDALAIEVSAQTLPAERIDELAAAAKALGGFAMTPVAAGYRVDVVNLGSARRTPPVADNAPIELKHAPAIAPADRFARESDRVTENGAIDILPALADALKAMDDRSHKGELAALPGQALANASTPHGQIAALADPRTQIIAAARHRDMATPILRATANLVCRLIEGRTIQDAGDHGAILAIHHLYAAAGRPKVSGILLPSNCGRTFADIAELLHRLRSSYNSLTGTGASANTFDTPPAAAWLALSSAQRQAEVGRALSDFCARQGIAADTLRAERIDDDLLGHPSRIVVAIESPASTDNVAALLRALERHLKSAVDSKLHLYLEPVKDRNRIRRL